ncbi:glutamine amidotransferase-related protein [Corynebacterium aquatimens]|uniref:GMP synthase (Glutamine-hydrolyzing) n=1 Tax=Corynebacterium aquatimens TaxID=1190508 RepID=A0A931E0I7_9CORY|nr:glutamine amidotransferase [Corynebacterium aquatimens]MBG6121627.1 GMP synthase (glutamine-hydrolyzing) [Corynebacterium aquatimens]WJY65834.1 GMP synthase [glutamine-hydrolyzing] [Corynebacterium aquatimens]
MTQHAQKLLFLSLRNGPIGPAVSHAEYHDTLRATGLTTDDVELRTIADESDELGSLDGIAGIVVGGSSLNITNAEYSPWQNHVHGILADIIEGEVPVFFVCYGISWLTHHLGGTISHSHPEASGPTIVSLTDAASDDPLLAGLPKLFTALTGHTENPDGTLPAKLSLLADGPTCPVQIVRYRDRVWATQFHAEMDAAAMKTRMDFYYDYGYFPQEDYDDIIAGLPSVDTVTSNEIVKRFAQHCLSH